MLEHVLSDSSFTESDLKFLRLAARIKKVRLQFEESLALYQLLVAHEKVKTDPVLLTRVFIDLAEFNRATFYYYRERHSP